VSSPAFTEGLETSLERVETDQDQALRGFTRRTSFLLGQIRRRLALFPSSESANAAPFAIVPVPEREVGPQGSTTTRINYELVLERAAQREIIDQLPVGIAMFWPDKRLCVANWKFIDSFGFSERWLSDRPHLEEILDAMRDNGTIGEQRDFAAFKRAKLETFAHLDGRLQEIWHLPNGKSQRVTLVPNAMGGVTMLFEDVTGEYELKIAYNALLKTQKATLDSIDQAIAVFGPDGKLKLHNAAFVKLWPIDEGTLARSPHIREIAEASMATLGRDDIWSAVTEAVNAIEAGRPDAADTLKRADGRLLSLTVTRLPDGGTMVAFSDLTD